MSICLNGPQGPFQQITFLHMGNFKSKVYRHGRPCIAVFIDTQDISVPILRLFHHFHKTARLVHGYHAPESARSFGGRQCGYQGRIQAIGHFHGPCFLPPSLVRIDRIGKFMNAYIRVLIGIGPGLNKGQSHFPVPDAVSILTVVKKAESQAVFRQIRPFMGTYFKFGRIPAVVAGSLPLHIAELYLIGGLGSVNLGRKINPQQNMMVSPVSPGHKIDSGQIGVEHNILLHKGARKPVRDGNNSPNRSPFL